jgi:uncharacterized membrane protein YgcG
LAPDDPTPPQNIVGALEEVSQRATALVREEIELAKAEVSQKVKKLIQAAVVGVAAGIFVVVGLLFLLHGASWLFFAFVFNEVFWGYFVVAGILFLLGGVAGFLASRFVKGGAPPTPDMAIEEARRIKETVRNPSPELGPGSAPAGADFAARDQPAGVELPR